MHTNSTIKKVKDGRKRFEQYFLLGNPRGHLWVNFFSCRLILRKRQEMKFSQTEQNWARVTIRVSVFTRSSRDSVFVSCQTVQQRFPDSPILLPVQLKKKHTRIKGVSCLTLVYQFQEGFFVFLTFVCCKIFVTAVIKVL